MALSPPKKKDSIRIPVFEHALPHRVLLQELQAQGFVAEADTKAVEVTEEAYGKLEAAKDALDDWSSKRTGLPENADLKLLQRVRDAERECKLCERIFTDKMHAAQRSALCFSGGGIRSASICLGVLQGLARFSMRDREGRPGLLHKLDFLSTVSGGGYIGSWLMAWARRHPRGYRGAVEEISKCGPTGADPEPRPVRHLREYTSYLAPKLGGLTLDTWALAATVVRNLFLNNCMLVPFFAALLCLPVLVAYGMSWAASYPVSPLWVWTFTIALTAALVLLCFVQSVSKQWLWKRRAQWMLFFSNLIICFAVAGLVVFWIASLADPDAFTIDLKTILKFAVFMLVPLLVPAAYGIRLLFQRQKHEPGTAWRRSWRFLFAAPLVAGATTMLLLILAKVAPAIGAALDAPPKSTANWTTYALWRIGDWKYVLGLPLVWSILLTGSSLFTGIVAKSDLEGNREWWARMKAVHMRLMLGWFAASLVALYGPFLFGAVVAAGTVVFGSISAFAGRSSSTAAQLKQATKKWSLETVASVCGILFLLLLAITLAAVNYALIQMALARYPNLGDLEVWGLYALLLFAFAVFCNFFFSINTFSLNHMYRSRLIRAYLGASNEFRTPDFFTNFDPDDNLNESDLPKGSGAPLHVINATLNLVATTNTAWTQRKAESFTFSPLHSGSFRVGYVPTKDYAGWKGVTLGTAMAISGAAFNPNMGYHSSPILTIIMTLFNVRLGSWLPNPRLDKGVGFFGRSSPKVALLPLLSEAVGNTNDTGNFVQLSDGGHFENLGLYEMVMRRCRRVIVVDGGADPKFQFDDLANAIRKIRIDLGIQIEFRQQNKMSSGNHPDALYCAIADIGYREIDGPCAEDGKLIYLKPAVKGTETIDIRNYAATHPDFPNEPTANQFFNEAQFESYRKLGMTMVQEIMACAAEKAYTIEEFFTAAGAV